MSYSRIVVGTDLSDAALQAARVAARIGHGRTRFRVVMVLSPSWPSPAESEERAQLRATVQAIELWAPLAGLPAAEPAACTGGVALAIAREAASFEADLVVVGHRGRNRRRILGSTARSVVRTTPTDVLVVRGKAPPEDTPLLRSIVVATDFQTPSKAAAARALTLAKAHEAPIDLVHCIDAGSWYDALVEPEEEDVGRALSEFNERHLHGEASETLLRGRPGVTVAQHAARSKADLIVIGNHGAGPIERAMIGSAADGIVEKAHCSVLVVRGGAAPHLV